MDRIKKIKIKQQDGTLSDYYPIGADAQNIDFTNGYNLDQIVGNINPDEDGTLEVQLSKTIKYYNTVVDMKADTKLQEGDLVETMGYYEVNDGGAAQYNIISSSENIIEDNGAYHQLNNGLFAEIIIKNKTVNIKQFGCKDNDQTINNFSLINNIITYLYNKYHGGQIFIPVGVFYGRPDLEFIYVRPNMTFYGLGEKSVIKVADATGSYTRVFGDFISGVADEVQNNLHFNNFCIDHNLDNNVQTSTANNRQRLSLNLARGAKNLIVENMHFYNNGVWTILTHGYNGVIRNNHILFKQIHTSTYYDVSSIYIEGTNFLVENNYITAAESGNLMIPQTSIEVHGSYHKIMNNYLKGYRSGIITIPNQIASPLTGDNNEISNNTILPVEIGIAIWAGAVGSSEGNHYHHNNIILTGNSAKFGIKVVYNVSPNLITLKNYVIENNTITYTNRTIDINLYSGYTGISSSNVTKIENFIIKNNIINNCGGNGIGLHIYADGDYVNTKSKNTKIIGNIFNNVYLPINLGKNYENTFIVNNIFNQDTLYDDYSLNMKKVLEHNAGSAKFFTFLNNKINTPLNLKPFSPTMDMSGFGLGVRFKRSENVVLSNNINTNEIPYLQKSATLKAKTIFGGNLFNEEGTIKKAVYSTIGTLKTASDTDVEITEWISKNHIRVNDATNIYPEMFISLNSNKFKGPYTYIISVVDNDLYLTDNLVYSFALKDGVTAEDVIGETIGFFNYSTTP